MNDDNNDARTEVIPACVGGDLPVPEVVPVGGKAPLPQRPAVHVPSVAETTPRSGLPILRSTIELGVVVIEPEEPAPAPVPSPEVEPLPPVPAGRRRRPSPVPSTDTPTYHQLIDEFGSRLSYNAQEVRYAW